MRYHDPILEELDFGYRVLLDLPLDQYIDSLSINIKFVYTFDVLVGLGHS